MASGDKKIRPKYVIIGTGIVFIIALIANILTISDSPKTKNLLDFLFGKSPVSETSFYEIALDPFDDVIFTETMAGYGAYPPHSITINNTGNSPTGKLIISLSGANASSFELNKTSVSNIAANKNNQFTVKPKTGLAAGTYVATVTVSGNNSIYESFDVGFTVCPADFEYRVIGNSVTITKYIGPGGNVVIPAIIDNKSVTSIDYGAFKDCSSLTSVTIPNSVTSIGGFAFQDCSSLTSVTIPNSVTSIGGFAFDGCSSLISVTIPNGVTSIGNRAFQYCSGLTSITIPNSVTSIGDGAFSRCSGLTSITIPNSVTSISNRVFQYCSGLTSITIPNSVTSIGDWTFWECSSLASVTMPNSVISIGDWAFSDCSGLTSITIPNSVTSIGDWAFSRCSRLEYAIFEGNAPALGRYVFSSVAPGFKIYFYEGTTGWTTPKWNGYPTEPLSPGSRG
ncbi:MAG: leucine-rich repeat protein [Clostridiales bacterium]|nr:leucine-rich repeat protein [Clostridiales bacterium]